MKVFFPSHFRESDLLPSAGPEAEEAGEGGRRGHGVEGEGELTGESFFLVC